MPKYKLKDFVSFVHIGQKMYTKKDNRIFDTEDNFKAYKDEVLSAFEKGFLDLVKEKPVKKVVTPPVVKAPVIKEEVVEEEIPEVVKEEPKYKKRKKRKY